MAGSERRPTAAERLEALMDKAADTLEAILNDPSVPAEARADLAVRLLALGAGAGPAVGALEGETLLPMQFVSIPDFLPPDLHGRIRETTLSLHDRFTPSTITSDAQDFRQSNVVYDEAFPELREALLAEIEAIMPAVFTGLARTPFTPSHIEMQLSAHGDGDYFKAHSDAAAPEIARREITFVYYFMLRQPCGFSGGALRLFQTLNGAVPQADPNQFQDIAPADNMIVFFVGRLMHEVQPLKVPSGAFEDGRFTLNGWLNR